MLINIEDCINEVICSKAVIFSIHETPRENIPNMACNVPTGILGQEDKRFYSKFPCIFHENDVITVFKKPYF